VITELTANLPVYRLGRAGLKEGADVAVESYHRGRNRATERKGDTVRLFGTNCLKGAVWRIYAM
jgi:hypothetical protein